MTNKKAVESLSDHELLLFNSSHSWSCFTFDGLGRVVGAPASEVKRNTPQDLPDLRISAFNSLFNLEGKRVLEVGCFEGVHTMGLMSYGANVTAVDARRKNVEKTRRRCSLYGYSPDVREVNVELEKEMLELGEFDFVCHIGVLYHLLDPVKHLTIILSQVRTALLLDTHYAKPEDVDHEYQSSSDQFAYQLKPEFGLDDAFSGVYGHSKWLTLEDIKRLFYRNGFRKFALLRDADERFGKRLTAFVSR
jgi:tRNA (mo5U34)-methyltransferase